MSQQNDPFADLPTTTEPKSSNGVWIGGIAALMIAAAVALYFGSQKKPESVPVVSTTVQAQQVLPAPQVSVSTPVAPEQPVVQVAPQSADGITICSGPAKGAFEQVVADINRLGLNLNVKPTTGAGDNLTYLHDGQCQYGLVNSDDYWARVHAENDPRIKNTRVVMGLFEGVVHMIAVNPDLARFSQSENKRVGVTGGAVATFSGLIVPKTGMTFDVIAYNSTKDLAKALVDGKVDMIVMVGAKPQPWINDLKILGAHLVEFDHFAAVGDIMTGKKDGFLGKRPVGAEDYPSLAFEKAPTKASGGKEQFKPVMQLTTRTVLATTKDANIDPKVAAKTKEIFRVLNGGISGLRKDGHESWKTVTTMNDPGGLPWATIR